MWEWKQWLAGAHGVLIGAEIGQGLVDEPVEIMQRLAPGDRIVEILQAAEMIAEPCGNEVDDLLRHLVHGIGGPLRRPHARLQGLAVGMVEVPLALGRLVALHQIAGLAPHLAIEILHAEFLVALCPVGKALMGGDEAVVGPDFDLARKLLAPILHHLADPPFAGLGDDDPVRRVALESPLQLAGEGAGIGPIVEPDIVDADIQLPQIIGEMAHGGEEKGDLALVVTDVIRLLRNLHHQYGIAGFEIAQRRGLATELIAENETKRCHDGPVSSS